MSELFVLRLTCTEPPDDFGCRHSLNLTFQGVLIDTRSNMQLAKKIMDRRWGAWVT